MQKAAQPDVRSRDFLTMFGHFRSAFSEGRHDELDDYVHPRLGLFVVGQPGTYVGVQRLSSMQPIATATKPDPLTSLHGVELGCDDVIDAAFPMATCGPDGLFSKMGCFHAEHPTLLTNPGHPFTVSHFYDSWLSQVPSVRGDRPPAGDRTRAREADALITDGVYDTASRLGFLFGRLQGRWVLLVIDKTDYCEV